MKLLKKERQSNFELLRIISMILIICHHYSVHGGFNLSAPMSANLLLIQILSVGGKIGVNCFVMISSYFMINSKKMRYKGVFKLVCQVVFISVLLYIMFVLTGKTNFSVMSAIRNFFALTFDRWWFASTYLVFMILIPFVNIFLRNVNKNMHLKLIVLLFFIWCIIPTFTSSNFQCNNLLWFMYLHIVVGYIKKYRVGFFYDNKKIIILLFVSVLLLIGPVVLFDILGTKYHIFSKYSLYFVGLCKLPVFLVSISLFCVFMNMKPFVNKIINFVASLMFSVYLIHDNNFVRPFLWRQLFKNASYQHSPYLVLHAAKCILIVFVGCSILGFIYSISFDKVFDKLYEPIKDITLGAYKKCKKRLIKNV